MKGGEVTLTSLVNDYINEIPEGQLFNVRDICNNIYIKTLGRRNPLDSTIGRMVRQWRADNSEWTVICHDYHKSLYKKIKKEATI